MKWWSFITFCILIASTISLAYVSAQLSIGGESTEKVINLLPPSNTTTTSSGSNGNVTSVSSANAFLSVSPTTGDVVITAYNMTPSPFFYNQTQNPFYYNHTDIVLNTNNNHTGNHTFLGNTKFRSLTGSYGPTLTVQGVLDTVTPAFAVLTSAGTANMFSYVENFLGAGYNVMTCQAPCAFGTSTLDTFFTMDAGVLTVAIGSFLSGSGLITSLSGTHIAYSDAEIVNITNSGNISTGGITKTGSLDVINNATFNDTLTVRYLNVTGNYTTPYAEYTLFGGSQSHDPTIMYRNNYSRDIQIEGMILLTNTVVAPNVAIRVNETSPLTNVGGYLCNVHTDDSLKAFTTHSVPNQLVWTTFSVTIPAGAYYSFCNYSAGSTTTVAQFRKTKIIIR